MEQKESKQNTIFFVLVLIAVFLLGFCAASLESLKDKLNDNQRGMDTLSREIRVLGVQVEDQSAVLIREGIMKPQDKKLGPILGADK
jgi:hypothetical protein